MTYDIIGRRYWNTNGMWIAIVVVRGGCGDWSPYIGAERTGRHEEDAVHAAPAQGCKLSERHARCLFPGVEGPYRD